eukprot:Hpha_TRINITY_DN15583_c3_g3::TRINITY_DN15583_c3_g3_i1::g.103995::m.103995
MSGAGDIYPLRRVAFRGRSVAVIVQNQNGPCPFIAICNVLLLRQHISISPDAGHVTLSELLNAATDWLFEKQSKRGLSHNPDMHYQLDDVIRHLPSLQDGMDVNVRFRSASDYEFMPAMVCYDAFDIKMLHGWVLDAADPEFAEVVGKNSYNGLTDLLIARNEIVDQREKREAAERRRKEQEKEKEKEEEKSPQEAGEKPPEKEEQEEVAAQAASTDAETGEGDKPAEAAEPDEAGAAGEPAGEPKTDEEAPKEEAQPQEEEAKPEPEDPQIRAKEDEVIRKAFVAEQFLSQTAGQLTYTGLIELCRVVEEGELVILFRNNHFSTLTKFQNRLFCLLTDVGYADMPEAVWELLAEIDGDMRIVNSQFQVPKDFGRQGNIMVAIDQRAGSGENSSQLEADARERQQRQQQEQSDADLALALNLQREEEIAAQQREMELRRQQQLRQQPTQQQQQQQQQQYPQQRQNQQRVQSYPQQRQEAPRRQQPGPGASRPTTSGASRPSQPPQKPPPRAKRQNQSSSGCCTQ